MQTVYTLFERVSRHRHAHETFADFTDCLIYLFCRCPENPNVSVFEDKYMALVNKYGKSGMDDFSQMLAATVILSETFQEDVLGELFMVKVSNGRNGQYFTPMPICRFMAEITATDELPPNRSVNDPACGSGRTLLAARFKDVNLHLRYYGSDIDPLCAKMCAVNLYLWGCTGEIACMDSLSYSEDRFSFSIRIAPLAMSYNTDPHESTFFRASLRAFFDKPATPALPEHPVKNTVTGNQLTFF